MAPTEPAFANGTVRHRCEPRAALDDVRSQGTHVIPMCPFIGACSRRHREYLDLVRRQIRTALKI